MAVVPGSAFGACAEGFVRMPIADADETILEGIGLMARMLSSGPRRAAQP